MGLAGRNPGQPFVSDANAALRLKALCLEPPRVSLRARQTAEAAQLRGQPGDDTQGDLKKFVCERNGFTFGKWCYQHEQHGHTHEHSQYTVFYMICLCECG